MTSRTSSIAVQHLLAAARLRFDRQVAELLTPEQRRRLQERRAPRGEVEHGVPSRHWFGRLG